MVCVALLTGCALHTEYPEDVWVNSIQDDLGVNGTQMRLYLQTGTTVKSILPWEHFLKFGNYDIIAVDTGIIKAATLQGGIVVLPEDTVINSPFLDAQKMGFTGIYLCCVNQSELPAQGLQLSGYDTIINGTEAYNLAIGLSFRLNTPSDPVIAMFEIWSVKEGGEAVRLAEDQFSISFYNVHHTKVGVSQFDGVPPADLLLSTTSDPLFTTLFNDLKMYDSTRRLEFYAKGDSANGTVYEKAIVYASAHNALLVLTQKLIKKVEPGYTFPTTSPKGTALPPVPPIGPLLDEYFGLYSNVSGLLTALNYFKEGYTLYKDESDDALQRYLSMWLENVVGDGNISL